MMNIVISIMTKGKDHPPHHIDWFKQTPPYDQVEQITHESTANLRNNDVDDYTYHGDNLMMLLTQIEPSSAQIPIYNPPPETSHPTQSAQSTYSLTVLHETRNTRNTRVHLCPQGAIFQI